MLRIGSSMLLQLPPSWHLQLLQSLSSSRRMLAAASLSCQAVYLLLLLLLLPVIVAWWFTLVVLGTSPQRACSGFPAPRIQAERSITGRTSIPAAQEHWLHSC